MDKSGFYVLIQMNMEKILLSHNIQGVDPRLISIVDNDSMYAYHW